MHDISTNKGKTEAALDFIHESTIEKEKEDSEEEEGEFLEYENAALEEVED